MFVTRRGASSREFCETYASGVVGGPRVNVPIVEKLSATVGGAGAAIHGPLAGGTFHALD